MGGGNGMNYFYKTFDADLFGRNKYKRIADMEVGVGCLESWISCPPVSFLLLTPAEKNSRRQIFPPLLLQLASFSLTASFAGSWHWQSYFSALWNDTVETQGKKIKPSSAWPLDNISLSPDRRTWISCSSGTTTSSGLPSRGRSVRPRRRRLRRRKGGLSQRRCSDFFNLLNVKNSKLKL